MLNARGGIECDLTVARLPMTNSTSSPAPASPHDFDWITQHSRGLMPG
jgi:glycine cleavage system aminomethyltransferase T